MNDDFSLPTHLWFVEWAQKPVDMKAFLNDIDQYLISINRSYEIRRRGEAIAMPQIYDLTKDALESWRKEHFKVKAQTKVPRMIRDTDICLSLAKRCERSA